MIAAGLKYLLLTVLLIVPGILIFYFVQKEDEKKVFTKVELVVAIIFIILFVFAIQELARGAITI